LAERDYADDLAAIIAQQPDVQLIVLGDALNNSTAFAEFMAQGERLPDQARLAARAKAGDEQPALIVYTSGTTGQPKGALLKHAGLVYCFRTQFLRMAVDPMISLCNLPINHIGCVGDLCCTPLVGGGTIHFMERFDPAAMLQLASAVQ
jgi:long-subunit acyl-CoA synthetase (AMP-forming)